MNDNTLSQEYLSEYKVKEQVIIDNLLKYLKIGEFPQTKQNFFLEIYNFVQHWANKDAESEDLYKNYEKIINEYSHEFLNQLNAKQSSEIIDTFIELSSRMDILINFLSKSFSFIDFYYCKFKKCPLLIEAALKIYREVLFLPCKEKLTIELNKLLKEDRAGRKEFRNKIKKITSILKTMDLTHPRLVKEKENIIWINGPAQAQAQDQGEKKEEEKNEIQEYWFKYFEKDTEQFVINKAKIDIQNRSTPEYVLIQLKFLEEEHERQNELLNHIFLERLNAIIYKEIIGKYMTDLVEMDSGVKNMLENNKYEELTNLYELFKYYEPSLHEISKVFKDYIETRGKALRSNQEIYKDPKKMVPKLIELQKEIDNLVKKCFKNNGILQKARDRAFNEFMKSDYYSKQLAFYLDSCMRSGFKGKTPEFVDSTLDDIIALFKNLNSKYIFQQETEKKMSDRLLKKVTISENHEKSFISKLKQESDIQLVSKMAGMMYDLEANKKETESYKNSASHGAPNGITFNVQVISINAWNVDQRHMIDIELPPLLSSCKDDFEQYYLKKYPEQKLIWYLDISKVEIQYLYMKNKNISISTLPQILILLELEKAGTLSIKNIAKNLKCASELVRDHIHGLIYNINFNQKGVYDKGVVICTTNQTQDLVETDEFKINNDFKSIKLKFITIPMPKKKTEQQLKDEENASAKEYQKYQEFLIQSNLVRIMKSRIGQVTTHNWLVSEAIKQIDRLKAQPQMIKDNIEKLIEKNYLKRDEANRGCYEYVA